MRILFPSLIAEGLLALATGKQHFLLLAPCVVIRNLSKVGLRSHFSDAI